METNETVKAGLVQAAEQEIYNLLTALQAVPVGNLKDLEQQVMQAVFALGARWLGEVLNGQARQEAPARREGSCGHRQRLVGLREKEVLTLVGQVKWKRPYYQCQTADGAALAESETACTHGEAPADVLWGLDERRTSPGVQQTVSFLAAQLTLEEAAETFSRLLPLSMSGRQVLTLLRPVGQALARREDEQVQALWQQAAQAQTEPEQVLAEQQAHAQLDPIKRLYIELDGVFARLRRGSVPMEEQEQQRPGDVYREVKVGAVFEACRGRDRSDLAPGVWVDEPAEGSIRYVARRTARGNFGPLLYTLASACGLSRAQQVVVLGDGAPWIWRLIEEHFPGAVQIVDLWHAQEHVWEVAHAVYGRSTAQGRAWAEAGCSLLVQGQIEALVQAIQALPAVPPEPGETRSVPEKAVDYFTTNALRMRYPEFRAQGMHVGSGIAEAACKTVVSNRAKRAGMRWTPAGLDAILPLRTAVLNGTYDAFWEPRSAVLT